MPTTSRTARSRPRIVVCGYMIRFPLAGNVFAYFHHLLGLHRLGYQVAYIEESGGWEGSFYDTVKQMAGDDPSTGLDFVRALLREHEMADVPVCCVHRETGRTWGCDRAEFLRIIDEADLMLNIGGICWLEEFSRIPRRAMIDMDPLFTQVGLFGAGVLARHHVHFTYGTNVGRAECTVPTAGMNWIGCVPPVVGSLWRAEAPPPGAPFTTIGSWNAYGGIVHEGEHYGQKSEEFLKLIGLPSRVSRRLEIAMGGGHDVRSTFQAAGWSIRDAGPISTDIRPYVGYIRDSFGEFSPAKNAYVKTRSGWFSDRSVCYLAAGRPVVVQDTGFTRNLPPDLAGRGILTFSNADEAADQLARVEAEYTLHATASAELVRRVFAHDVVLPRLIESAMA